MNTAANQPASHQSKDHLGETKISTCAFLPLKEQIPDPLFFSKHLIPYQGMNPVPGVVWGAWGAASHSTAQTICNLFAAKHGMFCVRIHLWFELSAAGNRSVMDQDLITETKFLNLNRLKQSVKSALKDEWLQAIADKHGATTQAKYSDLGLDQICAAFPYLAQNLLVGKQDLGGALPQAIQLDAVIHSVREALLDSSTDNFPLLQIASIRIESNRIRGVMAQYQRELDARI